MIFCILVVLGAFALGFANGMLSGYKDGKVYMRDLYYNYSKEYIEKELKNI